MKVSNLSKTFGDLASLDHLDFSVEPGEIVALIGPSGCGKSTLLNIISGLVQPDKGSVSGVPDRVGYVFQESRLLPWRTVFDNIRLAREENTPGAAQAVREWIDAVGLGGFEDYYPAQLSGGMAKRCAIALAFHHKSDLLLMDEPFQGLDYGIRMEMLNMLLSIWKKQRQGILFVTHEIDEALTVATRILVLSARPARVAWEVILPGKEGRDCADPELQDIRREIIWRILGR